MYQTGDPENRAADKPCTAGTESQLCSEQYFPGTPEGAGPCHRQHYRGVLSYFSSVGFGLNNDLQLLIARGDGANRPEEIGTLFNQGILITLLLSILSSGITSRIQWHDCHFCCDPFQRQEQ